MTCSKSISRFVIFFNIFSKVVPHVAFQHLSHQSVYGTTNRCNLLQNTVHSDFRSSARSNAATCLLILRVPASNGFLPSNVRAVPLRIDPQEYTGVRYLSPGGETTSNPGVWSASLHHRDTGTGKLGISNAYK